MKAWSNQTYPAPIKCGKKCVIHESRDWLVGRVVSANQGAQKSRIKNSVFRSGFLSLRRCNENHLLLNGDTRWKSFQATINIADNVQIIQSLFYKLLLKLCGTCQALDFVSLCFYVASVKQLITEYWDTLLFRLFQYDIHLPVCQFIVYTDNTKWLRYIATGTMTLIQAKLHACFFFTCIRNICYWGLGSLYIVYNFKMLLDNICLPWTLAEKIDENGLRMDYLYNIYWNSIWNIFNKNTHTKRNNRFHFSHTNPKSRKRDENEVLYFQSVF